MNDRKRSKGYSRKKKKLEETIASKVRRFPVLVSYFILKTKKILLLLFLVRQKCPLCIVKTHYFNPGGCGERFR